MVRSLELWHSSLLVCSQPPPQPPGCPRLSSLHPFLLHPGPPSPHPSLTTGAAAATATAAATRPPAPATSLSSSSVSQQQPFPNWTAGSAAFATHLSCASPASSAGGSVTTLLSSGFVGLLSPPATVASPMYASAIDETSFQYFALPSSTLDFVLDSGATDTVLRDAGTLRPLPTPTSLLRADCSFSIPCHNAFSLPCPLFPLGTVTSLHIPSLHTNLLSQRSLKQANITTVFPSGANQCALYYSSTGCLLSRIPFCPRSRLYTLRIPRPSSCQVASPSLLPPPSAPSH
ncbi:unnamed protein product [Closterium sp. NIES-53]